MLHYDTPAVWQVRQPTPSLTLLATGLCPLSVQLSVGCLENSNMKLCCDMARSSSGNIYLCIRKLSVVRCTDHGSVAPLTDYKHHSHIDISSCAPFIMWASQAVLIFVPTCESSRPGLGWRDLKCSLSFDITLSVMMEFA